MLVKLFNYKPINDNVLAEVNSILIEYLQVQPFEYPQRSTVYTVVYKQGEDKIVFLIKYGNNNLNECYKRDEKRFDSNTLDENTIHMTNQFIFAIKSDGILCSDHEKRNLIINMLHDADKSFSCQLAARLEGIDSFTKNLTSVESITIDATSNLFINEFLNPAWYDSVDNETPETTKVSLLFKRAINERAIKKFYKKLNETGCITAFNIKGENSEGFISINEEGIINKLEYEFEKDEEGYYDIEDIFEKI